MRVVHVGGPHDATKLRRPFEQHRTVIARMGDYAIRWDKPDNQAHPNRIADIYLQIWIDQVPGESHGWWLQVSLKLEGDEHPNGATAVSYTIVEAQLVQANLAEMFVMVGRGEWATGAIAPLLDRFLAAHLLTDRVGQTWEVPWTPLEVWLARVTAGWPESDD